MMKLKLVLSGIVIGIINSLFGAGGGMLAVPVLRKSGLQQKNAQASALAVILPLSVISTAAYLYKGYFSFYDGLRFIPFGLLGAFAGTLIMKRISEKLLQAVFSLLLIYSGLRMLLR